MKPTGHLFIFADQETKEKLELARAENAPLIPVYMAIFVALFYIFPFTHFPFFLVIQ